VAQPPQERNVELSKLRKRNVAAEPPLQSSALLRSPGSMIRCDDKQVPTGLFIPETQTVASVYFME
jgi:hypothetical protein